MTAAPESQPATAAPAIAQAFHEAYEDLAPGFSYTTRKASAKPWDEVPENNKGLMTATVQRLLDRGVITGTPAPEKQPVIVPEGGAIALRPAWSSTVVVASHGAIPVETRIYTLAAFAQDGLQAVFVDNAAAIMDVPPDSLLRNRLALLADSMDTEADLLEPAHIGPAGIVEHTEARVRREHAAKIRAVLESGQS
jgi:hypothetical protein